MPLKCGELFTDWPGWVGAIAGCAAAGVAAWQIAETRKETKRQAAFTHIREVEERLQKIWPVSPAQARKEILDYHCRNRDDLPKGAADYLAYLTALDLLVFACETGSVDGKIATSWLKGSLRRDDPTLEFIAEFQQACGDQSSFEYLGRHLLKERDKGLAKGQRK
jgi:hypothetical protein